MNSEFFTQNRQRLIKNNGNGLVVIAGHAQMQSSRDIGFHFEQERNFWYLCGIDEPNYWLVITPQEEFLIRPNVSEVEQWFEERSSLEELTNISGIEQIESYRAGRARLKKLINKYQTVRTLAAIQPRYMPIVPNPARAKLSSWLRANGAKLQTDSLAETLMSMRLIKQGVEVEEIRKAVNVTVNTFAKVKEQLNNLDWENEIEAEFTAEFRRAGLTHGYDPIIAAGKNATVLHYTSNNARLKRGDLVLLDIGARSNYYSADITRTYAYQESSDFAKSVHEAVQNALQVGIKAAKPGISYVDLEKIVEVAVGEGLIKLGLISKNTREQVRRFYPHSGHFLGLDVHDIGDYHAPLQAGNVITIEPGIYLPDKNVGVRIEEDILLTKAGNEVLSKALPTGL